MEKEMMNEHVEDRSNAFMVDLPVGKLMRKFSIPCIISLLVGALYNIVDQIFIANADYLGSYGNAANTVVFPLTVIALAIAVMIGDGACAFASICLGKGEEEKASKTVGSAVLVCLIASVLVTVIYLVFQRPILNFFGASVNEETFRQAKEYFFWITVGIPFYMLGQCLNPIIRSDGNPRFAMLASVLGAITNIILDPIFIYPLHMGMMGAAVATVLGQILTAGLSVWYLFHTRSIPLTGKSYRIHGSLMKAYIPLGITSLLSQISLVASMAAINNMVRKYSVLDPIFGQEQYTQIPMAVVGIVMKFFQIVISIAVGLSAGCIPVVGYNVGAGRKDRVKSLLKKLLIAEAVVGAVATLIAELLPNQLINIFGAGQESIYYRQFAVRAFRIFLSMTTLATVNKGTFIFLQSLGKAKESMALSLVREIVFGVGFALLLPLFMGLDGVLFQMPVADVLTFLMTIIVLIGISKELKKATN